MSEYYDDEEEEGSGFSWMNAIPFLLAAGIWIFLAGKYGEQTFDTAHIWATGIVIFFLLIKWSDSTLKVGSPKVISNPISSTFSGEIRDAGNFSMVRLGGIKRWGFYTRGSEGTMIAPASAINIRGNHIDIACAVKKLPLDELPHEVKAEIKDGDWPKPYWFGLTESIEFINVPDLSFLENMMRLQNRSYSELEKINKGDYGNMEKAMEHIKRLDDISKGSRFKNMFKPKEED